MWKILERHGCVLFFGWFLFFVLVWAFASLVTGAFVSATDPCYANSDPFCGLGVLGAVVLAGLAVAVVVTVIVVWGRVDSSSRGLGRVQGWALGVACAAWLMILGSFAISTSLERNEQRRVNAAYGEAQQVAEAEYEAALHEWWVDRVAEIVGVDLYPAGRLEPQPSIDALSDMCVTVGDELIASTMDGSRSLTAVWLANPRYGYWMGTCVRAAELPMDALRDFIATRGELGLVTRVRDEEDEYRLLLVFTTESATGTPLATEAQIELVADLMLAADPVFNSRVLCDAPDAAVVIQQVNGQPPYQDCPPVGGPGLTIALPDVEPPQIMISPPGLRVVAGYSPFRFSGATEPGATIYVDGVETETATDGQFEVWVPLTEGSQVVVFQAVDAAGNSTEASREVEFDSSLLVLRPGGIGVVSFGEEASVATDRLTELLGRPSQVEEESTANNPLPFGYGARNLVRVVGWDVVGLRVVFTDADYFRADGMLHLVAWYLSDGAPASLHTSSGISLDSSLDELKRQHPEDLWIAADFEECSGGWPVRIRDRDSSDVIHLIYKLDPSTPGATPASLRAGAGSTC
jgi:hypothetical protein